MYKGECYPNGSYFWDENVKSRENSIKCVIPDPSYNTFRWVRVKGNDPVDCNINNNDDPFHCTLQNNALSLFLPSGQKLLNDQEGYYKCCLSFHCSDHETITVNVFSKKQIIINYFYIFVCRICSDSLIYF